MTNNVKTLEFFPDDVSKKACIETLAGCVYILVDELKKHANVDKLPPIVGYHIGLGINLIGIIIGKIDPTKVKYHDITISDADYDQKLELVIETLIELRSVCRQRRENEPAIG